jgi:mono/diheme cytochrome c family protein
MKRFWIFLGIFIVLVIVFSLIFIYSGVYNVSALDHHSVFVEWVLSTTMDNSVKHHAKDIQVPATTDSSALVKGFYHYRHMCIGCHGAPGISRGRTAQGQYPEPPKLAETADEWTAAELFWITKNGVKDTGMPAWGPSASDEEIWDIVVFLGQLPAMSFEDFHAMEMSTETHEGSTQPKQSPDKD